ncbi:nad dependent epimerase [Seiridium cupressi]
MDHHAPARSRRQGPCSWASNDFEAVFEAAQGCKGVSLNTYPIPGLETHQATTVTEVCQKAGVKSIVSSSTFFTGYRALWDDQVTEEIGLRGYYLSKAKVEGIVRAAGFEAYTILRPAFIHFDYLLPSVHGNFPRLPTHGELDHAYNDGVRMPQTDGNDVERYAAAALLDPVKFGGQEIELANEFLTVQEARDIAARFSGKDVGLKKKSPEEVEAAKDTVFAQRFHFFANAKDLSDSLAASKKAETKFGIPFNSVEQALVRDKERLLECLSDLP